MQWQQKHRLITHVGFFLAGSLTQPIDWRLKSRWSISLPAFFDFKGKSVLSVIYVF